MANPIQCPGCAAEVEAETVQVGGFELIERCPACGDGPFTLNLEDAMAALGGDAVEVTIRAPQPQHIARALQDFHPDYGDTPIEELEQLVAERGGAAGATVAIPRLFAGVFAEGVRSRYPLLTVDCDVPLVTIGGDTERPMYYADDEDAALNAAIATARARVGDFVARLQAPQAGDSHFAIKVPFPTDRGGREHIWLGDVRIDGDEFVGVVANTPRSVPGLREGDERRCPIGAISDWLYMSGGEMVGNFTLKAVERALPNAPRDAAPAPTARGGLLRRIGRLFGLGADEAPPPTPRQTAANMLASLHRAFPPEQTYVLVAAYDVPVVAVPKLEEIGAAFARAGLTALCDFTPPSVRDADGNLVPIRTATASGILCGGYFLPVLGRITYEAESWLSDGRHLVTTTAVGNKFDQPPEFHVVTLASDTPFETVLATHRHRLDAIRRELPHVAVTAPTTPEALLEQAREASQRKHAYRREIGWLTATEFRRMQPEDGDPQLLAAIYRELRDLATRDAA